MSCPVFALLLVSKDIVTVIPYSNTNRKNFKCLHYRNLLFMCVLAITLGFYAKMKHSPRPVLESLHSSEVIYTLACVSVP
jgi:hypothetical protein